MGDQLVWSLPSPRLDCRRIALALTCLRWHDPDRYVVVGCGLRFLRENVRAWWQEFKRPEEMWCGVLTYFGVKLHFLYGHFEGQEFLSVRALTFSRPNEPLIAREHVGFIDRTEWLRVWAASADDSPAMLIA